LSQFLKVKDEQTALWFVNEYGPLRQSGLDEGEDPRDAVVFAQRARWLLLLHQSGKVRQLAKEVAADDYGIAVEAMLVPAPKGQDARLQLSVADLYRLIWFLFADALSGRTTIRECENCGKWFEVGPGSRPKRRLDATFCTSKCKEKHFNRNRDRSKGA
jgi:hypothetical protein